MKAVPIGSAIVTAIGAHTWTTTTPADVRFGALPLEDLLAFPAVGVSIPGGDRDGATIGTRRKIDRFEITFVSPVDLGDPAAALKLLIAMADEMESVVAASPTWSLGYVDGTVSTGWESGMLAVAADSGDGVDWLLSVTLKLEVRYRE